MKEYEPVNPAVRVDGITLLTSIAAWIAVSPGAAAVDMALVRLKIIIILLAPPFMSLLVLVSSPLPFGFYSLRAV